MKVIIQNASEIEAQGMPRNGNSKKVICLDTGEVFTAAKDAAEKANVHPSTMSWCLTGRQKTCGGKHYCYLDKLNEHLDEFTTNMRTIYDKANKYDALMEKETKPVPAIPEPVKADTNTAPTTTVTTYTVPKRKASKPLQKAREMVERTSNIISFFRAI